MSFGRVMWTRAQAVYKEVTGAWNPPRPCSTCVFMSSSICSGMAASDFESGARAPETKKMSKKDQKAMERSNSQDFDVFDQSDEEAEVANPLDTGAAAV